MMGSSAGGLSQCVTFREMFENAAHDRFTSFNNDFMIFEPDHVGFPKWMFKIFFGFAVFIKYTFFEIK